MLTEVVLRYLHLPGSWEGRGSLKPAPGSDDFRVGQRGLSGFGKMFSSSQSEGAQNTKVSDPAKNHRWLQFFFVALWLVIKNGEWGDRHCAKYFL